MIKLLEPQWGIAISKALFAWMQASVFWAQWIPVLADVFVFTYPVYLVALYIVGRVKMLKRGNIKMLNEGMQYKISAIFIFCGTFLSVVVNIFIQYLVDKARPNIVLGLLDLKRETILHNFLPSSSFPSDHAAVSMGIAFSSIAWGVKNKDKKYIRFGIVLIVFSLITSFSRVTTGVHRATDVIVGSIIGIVVPRVLMNKKIYSLIEKLGKWAGKLI